MTKYTIPFMIVIFLFVVTSKSFADRSLAAINDDIKEDVVRVNDIMVEKDRVKALDAIDSAMGKLKDTTDPAEIDVYQNLNRLKFHLSKYNWDMARRILDDLMTELNLEYQPTFPD